MAQEPKYTPENVALVNDELSELADEFKDGGYAHLHENGRLQLDASFSREYILKVIETVGWITD